MLFFSYNNKDPRRSIFEVDINGQRANNPDDDDTPTDYTAEDDEGVEDTGAPADDTPAPNPNPAAPQATQDDTNPTDNPEDYTLPDNEDQGDEPPGGGMDNRMNTTPPAPASTTTGGEGDGAAPADYTADTGGGDAGGEGTAPAEGGDPGTEGGDTGPTDYTGGDTGGGEGAPAEGEPAEGEGGGDPGATGGAEGGVEGDPGTEGGNDAGGDPGADDTGDDDTGSSDSDDYNQQIQNLDKDLYADLSEPQMDIRNKELKRNFASLYDMINDIVERINDISKDSESVKPLEFVTIKLGDLADRVSDYLVYTYSTKSYTENEINYNLAGVVDFIEGHIESNPQSALMD